MDIKLAIEGGDVGALRALLATDPSLANQLIVWGNRCEIRTHPLHYVSDMLFGGTLERGKQLTLVEALIEAGADVNHCASNGETPLMGAASLNSEDVALRLLDAGAHPDTLGLFNATPLHWAATLGLDRLVARLIEMGADVNRKDTQYHSPPMGWAIHGLYNSPPGSGGNHHHVVALLVKGGAKVEPEWLTDERIRADPAMLAALRGEAAVD